MWLIRIFLCVLYRVLSPALAVIMETCMWIHKGARGVFGTTRAFALQTISMAANRGSGGMGSVGGRGGGEAHYGSNASHHV